MPYTQVTLAQLRAQLQQKYESVPFWTDIEANLAINETLQWYNLYTGTWKARVALTTVANQVYYTTPSTLIYNARFEFNSQPLAMSSVNDLDNGRPGWEGETTVSGGSVPSIPNVWAPLGLTTFVLWPADASGSNGLVIDGVHQTPTLTSDGQYVDLSSNDTDDIVGEALYILCFKDGGRVPRASQWHQNFLQMVLATNARLKAANAFRAPAGFDMARQTIPLSVGDDDHG